MSLNAQSTFSLNKLEEIESSNNYDYNITQIEKELKKEHSNNDLLKLQTLLITNYINTFQFNKASSFCQEKILEAKKNKLPFHEANLYRYLGNVYYHLKQIDKAELYWNQCLQIAEEHQYNELLKKCNHNIGVIAFENEINYTKAEIYFLKAIEFGKKIPQNKIENLAGQYRLLASIYDVIGKYKKADSLFKITEQIYNLYQDSLGLAEALTFHSRLYLSMKRYDAALQLNKQSVLISELLKNNELLQTALSIYVQIQINLENYKEAFLAEKRIFEIETSKNILNQKKEIAEAEAKFKIGEIRIKQELLEVQTKQTQQTYFFTFLILFIIIIGFIIIIYQRRIAKKEQLLLVKSTKEVYDAQEKERSRIAQDLHDNMGAHTTSILAQIDSIELSLNDAKNIKIKDLRTDAENIMATLRETIWILKTKAITADQFFDLLKIYADKHLSKNLNITVTYKEEIHTQQNLSPAESLNLYRIMQEIIQNIVKHAKATQVEFILLSNEKVAFRITDNGVGFDYSHLIRKGGLDNIQFRANEIGYSVLVKSEPNNGTQILLEPKI